MGPIQPGNGTGTFPQFEYANSQCLLDMFRFILAVLPKKYGGHHADRRCLNKSKHVYKIMIFFK